MRACFTTYFTALAIGVLGCSGSPPPKAPTPSTNESSRSSGLPAWLPPYTPAQLALLRPGDVPVQVPAARVFPDLNRFGYANNHRMDDPTESLKFTRMVAKILTDSPHYYVIDEASATLSNTVAQYGPPGPVEPDAWQTVRRGDDGAGKLVAAPLSDAAKSALARGQARGQARDLPGAIAAYREAAAKSPSAAGLQIALAGALATGDDLAGAEAAYEAAVRADPTLATAHAGLAEIYERRGDIPKARHELAEALAYHPNSRRALALADRLTHGTASSGAGRIRPFAVFLDVDSVGAVRVAAPAEMPAQMYASCRAVMRYEPEVRAFIFEQPEGTPYYLSVVEEVVCLEAAIGAYLFEQHRDDEATDDPTIEALLELAHEEGLVGYAMFEILGRHRPERARAAPPDVHSAVIKYVERYVLGEGEPLPEGVYTAHR